MDINIRIQIPYAQPLPMRICGKKVTGKNYVPARAGEINSETAFVLDRFHTEVPGYMGDVRTQVRDVEVAPAYNGHPEMSIREAWASLQEKQISTLTIVDDKDKLVGLITKGDIAKTYMGVYDSRVLSENKTPYKNICATLDGEMLVGDPEGVVEKRKDFNCCGKSGFDGRIY